MDLWSIGEGGWGQSVMKMIQCSGPTWIYCQLEEGAWSQSVMKMIQCSGLTWSYGQLKVGVGSVCHETYSV